LARSIGLKVCLLISLVGFLLSCGSDTTVPAGGDTGILFGNGDLAGNLDGSSGQNTSDIGTSAPDVPNTSLDQGSSVPADTGGSTASDTTTVLPCEPGSIEICMASCGSIGQRQCLKYWSACVPPQENCNDCLDNDCDGVVNNGCPPNLDCEPESEPCDCIDNDNDGFIDEGCVPKPQCDKEPCDCIDNDGDGTVDEGCPWWWFCDPEQECDCIDNDNDGQIDESCDPLPEECPGEECDCEDTDGDGLIDEECDCIPGTWRWCDEPVYCSWGKQTCLPNGKWAVCVEVDEAPPGCDEGGLFEGDIPLYDVGCCVDSGACCQNYPANDSVGDCTSWSCE